MRILQVGGLAGPGPVAGGVWRVADTQTSILRQRGHHVSLFGLWLDEQPPEAGDTHYLAARPPFPGAGYRGLVTRDLRARIEAAGPYDVAHIHLARDYITTRSLAIAKRLGIPVVVQTHGMVSVASKPSTKAFDLLFKRGMLSRPDVWLSLTDTEERQLGEYGARAIRSIPNPVLPTGLRWEPDQEEPYILFASRLHPRKQADVLVRAVDRALEQCPDMRLVIAGPDEGHLGAVQASIAASRNPSRFEVVGPLPQPEVRARLAAATIMCLPSRDEVAPMIAIESCEIGTPMVLTSDCGLSAGLAADNAASIADPEEAALSDALVRLWRDADERNRLSAAERNYYDGHWAPDEVGTQLEAVYNSVITTGGE